MLLDRAPAAAVADTGAADTPELPGEEHLRVRRLLTRMAAAEPHRYVVVDADGSADEVAERVRAELAQVLPMSPEPAAGAGDAEAPRDTVAAVARPGTRISP